MIKIIIHRAATTKREQEGEQKEKKRPTVLHTVVDYIEIYRYSGPIY